MKMKWNKWRKNIGLKVISILIAFGIWLMVVNTNDPEKTQPFSVTVTIENKEKLEDAGKVYRVRDNTDEVKIWVTARKSVIQSLKSSDFKVIADFENLNEALGSIPLVVECTNSKITEDKIKVLPPSLKIELENKKEQEFVLNVEKTGTPAKGYEVASIEAVQGKKIYIAGAESLLKIIGKVSVPVSVQGSSADRTVTSSIRITDKNGAVFTENQMNSLELKTMEGAVIS
ncbi:MAG: CdaR family protein, partial [Lachnospiraceae bacterium]|nr:CdaR family protein [Robinsoniella sp.]MDY3767618.1 CdaR family protein [Lachnospiraceae bacterium]